MKDSWRRLSVGVIGAAACITLAAPLAQADVIETGSKNCSGATPFSYLQYKTKGDRAVKAPGSSTTYASGSSTTWYKSERQGADGGGSWFVNGYVDLDQNYTKAFCRNYG